MNNVYTTTERAFLHDYFCLQRPDELRNVDVYEPADGIFLDRSDNGEDIELKNAVARLALKRVQDRLPAWSTLDSKGTFIEPRRYFDSDDREIELMPQHLFTINWADSGPGFSWPESYHLVWFPEFDRYVVTASQDSTDAWGAEDLAVGFGPFSEDWIQVAHDILFDYWDQEHKPYVEEGWIEVLDAGFIPEHIAITWRDEVWPEPEDELDEEFDDE